MARETAQAAVALGGGHGLVRHAVGAAPAPRRPHHRRADRGRDRRRQRRVVGSAAGRVRRTAPRRPADGARRALRRRRVGPHLGRRRPAPLRRAGRDAGPRRRQPADRVAVGADGRPRPRARLGGPAARRPRPGAADGDHADGHHRRGARRSTRHDPTAVTVVRGQVEVATTDGQIESVALVPADPRGVRRRRSTAILAAEWVVLGPGSWFTSVIPHLMVPGLRRALAETDGPARRRAQPRGAGGGDDRLRARPTTSPRSSSTPPTSPSTPCSSDASAVARRPRAAGEGRGRPGCPAGRRGHRRPGRAAARSRPARGRVRAHRRRG